MAIVVQGQTSTNLAAGSSTTITKPSGFSANEILVAHIFIQQQSATTPDFLVPTGWTAVRQNFNLNAGSYLGIINTYFKAYDPNVDATATNYTFTTANTIIGMGGGLLRISGASTISPFVDQNGGSDNRNNSAILTDTITPVIASSLILFPIMTAQNMSTDATGNITTFAVTTDNPTWTRQVSLNGFPTVANACAIATAIRTQTTATGNSTAGMAGNYTNPINWTGQLFAVTPVTILSVSETVIVTDGTVGLSIVIVLQEVLLLTESILNSAVTAWTNIVKNISNWINTSRHN